MRARTITLAVLVVLSILLAPPAAAFAQIPSLPHYFYGTLKIDNVDASIGTTVEARVAGVQNGPFNPITTTQAGRYSDPEPPFSYGLLVQGEIVDGATIEFFVNGVKANQTAAWHSGQNTMLNLTAGSVTPPTLTPPTVITSGVNGITANSASLFATLTNLGTATSVSVLFEYWTTVAYGSNTTAQVKTAPVTFTAGLTGLLPDTLYHFRARANGGTSGLALSADATFTTLSPGRVAPTVLTDTASGITVNSATLNGNLTALGTASSANVSFDWGTSPGVYASSTPIQAQAALSTFSASLSGLSTNTTYYFRARAEAGIHGTSLAVEKSFVTLASTSGPGGGGGGGGTASGPNTTPALSGITGAAPTLDNRGKAVTPATLATADGKVAITVAVGTQMTDKSGLAIPTLTAAPLLTPPPPPSKGSVLLAYDFGPTGAQFNPPLTMTMSFDPAAIPAGASLNKLFVAFWDGSRWVKLSSTVNPATNTITALVSHFTEFSILFDPEAAETTPTTTPTPPSPEITPPSATLPPVAPVTTTPTSSPAPPSVPNSGGINWLTIGGLAAAALVGALLAAFIMMRVRR